MNGDILERLTDPALVALCVEGDVWPRGLLSETPLPAKWMGLLIRPDDRRRLVPPGEDPRTQRGDRLVLIRKRPVTATLGVNDCPAAGDNPVSCVCEVQVRWPAHEDGLAALQQTLLSAGPLTSERLAEELSQAGGEAALRALIGDRTAEQLLRDDQRDEFLAVLQERLRKFAFETGMEIERITKLDFTSESFAEQQALERETRRRVERIKAAELVEKASLAATKRRLGDLSSILDKLKAAAAGDERMQWHELLPALSPADRGKLLENLWRLTPDRNVAASIVIVAGRECIWLDPAQPERIVRRVTLAEELGGVRSVGFSPVGNRLLVGAARGVWALDASSGEITGRFEVPNGEMPRTGFNAAVIMGERLYATNSALGCWSWSLDDPSDAQPVLVPEGGVPRRTRAVVATDDGRVLFAADDCVQSFQPDTGELSVLSSGTDVIHCMTVRDGKLFVGTGDGKLFRVDIDHPDDWWLVQQFMSPVESVQARRWSDLVELVVPAGARGVSGIYDEQSVVTNLLSSATPIRRVWACDDLIVGLNQLRDRLVVMNANLPERTGREARLARLTGQSIQDACIVLSSAAT